MNSSIESCLNSIEDLEGREIKTPVKRVSQSSLTSALKKKKARRQLFESTSRSFLDDEASQDHG